MIRATPERVISRVSCAHCRGAIELACEGLTGFYGYRTYNEYFCPHCRKQNHVLSTGAVLSARVPAAVTDLASGEDRAFHDGRTRR